MICAIYIFCHLLSEPLEEAWEIRAFLTGVACMIGEGLSRLVSSALQPGCGKQLQIVVANSTITV